MDYQQHSTNQKMNEKGPGSFVFVELSQEQETEEHMDTSDDPVVVTHDDVSSKTYFFSFSRGTSLKWKTKSTNVQKHQLPLSFSSRGDGVTSAFSKLRPIWISHLYYFFPKMGKLK